MPAVLHTELPPTGTYGKPVCVHVRAWRRIRPGDRKGVSSKKKEIAGMRIIFLLLSLLAVALAVPRTSLDLQQKGAKCYYLNKYGSRNASITLKGGRVVPTGSDELVDYKVPYLVFKYTEFEHAHIPSVETYATYYATDKLALYKKVLDPATNHFRLTFKPDQHLPSEDSFATGILALSEEHVFDAPSLGFYCVYIAPPVIEGVEDYSLALVFQNSHGSLPILDYISYQNRKVSVLVGAAIFAYLLHYIIKFKVSSDYRNFDSISIISKSVILYVLFPVVVLSMIQCVGSFFENFVLSESFINVFFQFFNWGNMWLTGVFNAAFNFFVLLLSMGYGVMYDNVANLRQPLPPNQWRLAKYMFCGAVAIRTLLLVFFMFGPNDAIFVDSDEWQTSMLPMSGSYPLGHKRVFSAYLVGAATLSELAWFVLTMVYYVRTRKTLAHFAPVSDAPFSDTLETNEQIIKGFRRSILIIFVLPLFIAFLSMFVLVWVIVHNDTNLLMGTDATAEMLLSVYQVLFAEKYVSSGVVSIMVWSNWLYIYLGVILVFFVWIKDNNGLLVNEQIRSTTEYNDDARFLVSSD